MVCGRWQPCNHQPAMVKHQLLCKRVLTHLVKGGVCLKIVQDALLHMHHAEFGMGTHTAVMNLPCLSSHVCVLRPACVLCIMSAKSQINNALQELCHG